MDTSIIHLRRTYLFTKVIPSNLLDCLGMGIPVLHGVQGESARIVEAEGLRLVFETEGVEALRRVLERVGGDTKLAARLKAQGFLAARKYDRTQLAHAMMGIIQSVA